MPIQDIVRSIVLIFTIMFSFTIGYSIRSNEGPSIDNAEPPIVSKTWSSHQIQTNVISKTPGVFPAAAVVTDEVLTKKPELKKVADPNKEHLVMIEKLEQQLIETQFERDHAVSKLKLEICRLKVTINDFKTKYPIDENEILIKNSEQELRINELEDLIERYDIRAEIDRMPKWKQNISKKLNLNAGDTYDNIAISEIIVAFQSIYEVSIIVDKSINTERPITLATHNMNFKQALNNLVNEMGTKGSVGWSLKNGAICIEKK